MPVSDCRLETLVTVLRPIAQKFEIPFDDLLDSPILTLRAGAPSLIDLTGSIPDFRFDIAAPKHVDLTTWTLTSLTPPETTAVVDDKVGEAPAPTMIVGIASTYNPMNPADKYAGSLQTASGEIYDATEWTAAIRLDLRQQFGGVRYGRNYRPTYAMVEAGDKRVIVKINDVGPLRPGRIIDLNERTMRFFDPTLQRGLIHGVRVSPLEGTEWIAGPVGLGEETMTLAGRLVQ